MRNFLRLRLHLIVSIHYHLYYGLVTLECLRYVRENLLAAQLVYPLAQKMFRILHLNTYIYNK